MFHWLKKGLLSLATASLKSVPCPDCGVKFSPFGGRTPNDWNEQCACPKCGHTFTVRMLLEKKSSASINPPGPFEQPAGTKIERRPVSDTELLFHIPRSGRSGGMMFFAIFWNAISWAVFAGFAAGVLRGQAPLLPILFVSLFPAIGIGLLYAALRNKYAVHLLYLGPDRVRLQRQLFGRRKNYDLATSTVRHVRKVEFYQQNYQPVYGIEILGDGGKIRFGSILTDDEKNWLCWEIREFLRPCAPGL
jgi:hypothetical protein